MTRPFPCSRASVPAAIPPPRSFPGLPAEGDGPTPGESRAPGRKGCPGPVPPNPCGWWGGKSSGAGVVLSPRLPPARLPSQRVQSGAEAPPLGFPSGKLRMRPSFPASPSDSPGMFFTTSPSILVKHSPTFCLGAEGNRCWSRNACRKERTERIGNWNAKYQLGCRTWVFGLGAGVSGGADQGTKVVQRPPELIGFSP